MKLDVKALALATGVLGGLVVWLLTLSAVWRGAGDHIGIAFGLYPGYHVSWLGSVIGLLYGLCSGVVVGAGFAWLYNRLAGGRVMRQ